MKGKAALCLLIIGVGLTAVLLLFPTRDPDSKNSKLPHFETGSGADNGLFPPNFDPGSATPQQLHESMARSGNANANNVTFPTAPDEAREFTDLDETAIQALNLLIEEFRAADEDRQLEILEEIEANYYGEQVLELVSWALARASEDVKLRTIELVAGNISPKIIALMERALTDLSENVRMESVIAVSHIRGPEVVDFVSKAFEDASSNVRFGALETVEHQTSANKLKILGQALASSHADVATAGLAEIEVDASPASVDTIIGGLDSRNAEVVQETRYSLAFLFDIEFQNSAEAHAWWAENRQRYDSDLVEIE